MSRESAQAPQRPHRDTERVLAALQPGDPVCVRRQGSTSARYGDVADVGLDGLAVRFLNGTTATVRVHSASRPDRVSPPDLEVLS